MKIEFSDRAKRSLECGQEQQREGTRPASAHEVFNELLRKVGARTRMEDGKPVLRFEPPLETPGVDPDRWEMAEKLEGLFWELCEEHGY